MLYCGPVEEMNKNFGSILIDAANRTVLKEFLKEQSYAGSIEEHPDGLTVKLLTAVNTTQINQDAFNKGIILSQLLFKKQSLEDQFIELTKN